MRKIHIITILFWGFSLSAQNDLKSYQWRDHLPYNTAFSVTNQGNKIFAVSNVCVFSYNKSDNSYDRLNKVYGYSDIEPTIVKNNPYNNALMIVYKNSNIDIVKDGVIINVSDLLRKQNIGDKTVNSITFNGPLAYLSCGFGIVVFNTETFEFKDTYIIGPGATNLNVYQVALSTTDIFAATKSGIYKASLTSPNLSSYTSWSKVTNLPAGPYNAIVYFGGKIIANFSKFTLSNQTLLQDTLFQFDGTSWSKYTSKIYVMGPSNSYFIRAMSVSDDNTKFFTCDQWGFEAFDVSGNIAARVWDFGFPYTSVFGVVSDPSETDVYWAATTSQGLLKVKNQASSAVALSAQTYFINGPSSSGSAQIAIMDNKVVVAPAYLDLGQFPSFNQNSVYSFHENTWTTALKVDTDYLFDISTVTFDRNDKNHYYAGNWYNGVIEYQNDVQIQRYDYTNTAGLVHQTDYPGSTITRVGGVTTDRDNNLWVALGETQHLFSVKKAGTNTWISLDFAAITGTSLTNLQRLSQIIVDSSKQVWGISYGTGLFVYKADANFSQPNNSNAKKLINITGKGGLPTLEVISIAEDKNGDIWVGTNKGIYVFYNPESIFTQTTGWDAQPIYIEQDGQTQLLLQTDEVTCVTVDGANNKWCGTRSSGLYCFSPDGQKQLYHFTTDNSPVFSNSIIDVKVNPKTGEVFISTNKGMLSFQNITTEGFENFTNVYAYPNPVKPNYDGPILIHGMINNAVVKILDVAGNFVFETISQGGQAVWNGKNFSGSRVASGVYIVLCQTSDGDQKIMTKIMLLN